MTRRVLRGFDTHAFTEARHRRGISVSDLSRLANVSPATLFNWESGKNTPQVDLLARVMRILDTSIEHVVTIPADQRYPGDWRVIKGLTQPELAAAAKIPTTTLRGIERADAALTDVNADKLAKHLDISVQEYRAAYQRARTRPAGAPI
ncbi:MAG: helix-turn-helix transcriptional regulator [Actinomycetia bacterium]|nr:helix-turn-helix transcriptional regulator [Actinomycetes bacterium]